MGAQDPLDRALQGNKSFSKRIAQQNPELLAALAKGQSPEILWIGCADSRVPETTICDCQPGDIFVHRNIANCLHPSDLNSASVIEYATAHLKVKTIVVCGHTKCGGAAAGMGDADLGEILNTWLVPIRDLRRRHKAELDKLESDDAKVVRLAELNVTRSVDTLRGNPTVKKAISERGLTIHGVIYDVATGELREIETARKSEGGNYGLWTPN